MKVKTRLLLDSMMIVTLHATCTQVAVLLISKMMQIDSYPHNDRIVVGGELPGPFCSILEKKLL